MEGGHARRGELVKQKPGHVHRGRGHAGDEGLRLERNNLVSLYNVCANVRRKRARQGCCPQPTRACAWCGYWDESRSGPDMWELGGHEMDPKKGQNWPLCSVVSGLQK